MDGFEENDRIIMVGATNFASNLDSALTRPGRFDRNIKISLPDVFARVNILKIHLREKNHSLSDQDINKAATFLDGCSGAEIENLVNQAALQTVRQAKKDRNRDPCIGAPEFEKAIEVFNK